MIVRAATGTAYVNKPGPVEEAGAVPVEVEEKDVVELVAEVLVLEVPLTTCRIGVTRRTRSVSGGTVTSPRPELPNVEHLPPA